MRYVLMAAMLVGCQRRDSAREKEIAELRAQVAKLAEKSAESEHPAAKEETPSAPSTRKVYDESKATADNERLGADAPGEMTGKWLEELLRRADENKSITYAHLKKNADRYATQAWSCRGRILEISEETLPNGPTFSSGRLSLSDYTDEVIAFVAPFTTDFVQGKVVDLAGFLTGKITYQSQAGWTITIPSIAARSIAKAGAFAKIRAAHSRPKPKPALSTIE